MGGGVKAEMERLAAEYRERIKAPNAAIKYKVHIRDVREKEVRAGAVMRRRTNTKRLERGDVEMIKVEEAERMEVER